MAKSIFQGRTKNDIKQCYFLAKLFNMPIEEIAKPVKFTDEHYKPKEAPEDLDKFLELLENK